MILMPMLKVDPNEYKELMESRKKTNEEPPPPQIASGQRQRGSGRRRD